MCFLKLNIKMDEEDIALKRKYIHDSMIRYYNLKENFSKITSQNLQDIFEMYDYVFFGNQISEKLHNTRSTVGFIVEPGSSRTTSAGSCTTQKSPGGSRCFFELRFPESIYINLFQSSEKSLRVNGLKCWGKLSCLQMVFEHELMHLLMKLYGYEGEGKIYSAHGLLFKCMVKTVFGHTETKHSLLRGESILNPLEKKDAYVGMRVFLFDDKKQKIYGTITKINPKFAHLKREDNGSMWKIRYHGLQDASKEDVMPSTPPHSKLKVKVTTPPQRHNLPIYKKNTEAKGITSNFKIGQRVSFKTKINGEDELITGTITKVNPKTVILNTEKPEFVKQKFKTIKVYKTQLFLA